MENLTTVLSIAGSDCMAGAGIQADIKAASNLGVYCLTAVTSITAQNSHSLDKVQSVSPEMLRAQLNAIDIDVKPDAVKIGMTGSWENSKIILDFISKNHEIPTVVDPVTEATVGGNLIENDSDKTSILEFYRQLTNFSNVIMTPNLGELSSILGIDIRDGINRETIELEIKNKLSEKRMPALILTGIKRNECFLEDILFLKSEPSEIEITRQKKKIISGNNLHGTGCTFSTLLASFLAKRYEIKEAFTGASHLMETIISDSKNYQLGNSIYGPLLLNPGYKI